MASGTIQKEYIYEDIYSGSLTTSNGYKEGYIDIVKTGYKPIGIAGYTANTTWLFVASAHITLSGKLHYIVRSPGGADYDFNLQATIIYEKA